MLRSGCRPCPDRKAIHQPYLNGDRPERGHEKALAPGAWPGLALKKSLLLTGLQFLPWDDQGSNTLPPTRDSGVDHHRSGGKKHPNFYWTGKGSKFLTGALQHSKWSCVSLHDGACRVLTLSENDCRLTEAVTRACACACACVSVCVVRRLQNANSLRSPQVSL